MIDLLCHDCFSVAKIRLKKTLHTLDCGRYKKVFQMKAEVKRKISKTLNYLSEAKCKNYKNLFESMKRNQRKPIIRNKYYSLKIT